MKINRVLVGCAAACVLSVAASAGIPEPDFILYGQVCIGGSPASAEDDVTVIAKADVAGQVREVGRYKMGDYPPANDCQGEDDCYVLRIRLESVPQGESPAGTAVVLNREAPATVQLVLVRAEQQEQQVAQQKVSDSGIIRRLDLRDVPSTADLNNDGHTGLADYQMLRPSFSGPGVQSTVSCAGHDLNGDGHTDMRDFAILQAAFSSSAP